MGEVSDFDLSFSASFLDHGTSSCAVVSFTSDEG